MVLWRPAPHDQAAVVSTAATAEPLASCLAAQNGAGTRRRGESYERTKQDFQLLFSFCEVHVSWVENMQNVRGWDGGVWRRYVEESIYFLTSCPLLWEAVNSKCIRGQVEGRGGSPGTRFLPPGLYRPVGVRGAGLYRPLSPSTAHALPMPRCEPSCD